MQYSWFALYTRSRHEKHVARELELRALECFLPLYDSCPRRNGYHRATYHPLFPGYVFVHLAPESRVRALQVPGVVRFVSFNGQPAPLSEFEVTTLRHALEQDVRAVPHPYLKIGREVEIVSGPLKGLRGTVRRRHNKWSLVLSVDLLHSSIIIDMDSIECAPSAIMIPTARVGYDRAVPMLPTPALIQSHNPDLLRKS